jgi:hypothetical protein
VRAREHVRCLTPKSPRLSLLTVALVVLSGCPTPPAQPQGSVAPEADYLHAASGMTFPPAIGEFRRVDIRRYDASGRDVSVGYNAGGAAHGIAATVYVYPAPPVVSVGSPDSVIAARSTSIEQEFKMRQREIMGAHPDAKMLNEGNAKLQQGSESCAGRKQRSRSSRCLRENNNESAPNFTSSASSAASGS